MEQFIIWFLRILGIPIGVVCVLVALDLLKVWGVKGGKRSVRRRRSSYGQNPRRYGGRASRGSYRPAPDTWIWWDGQVRAPAVYLLVLGLLLVACSVIAWMPGLPSLPLIDRNVPAIGLLLIGLILLRGTIKISSPRVWKSITFIKRPLSGRAHPSPYWMVLGLGFCLLAIYGFLCGFQSLAICINSQYTTMVMLIFTLLEFVFAGIGAMGLEDIIQSWQEGNPVAPRSVTLLGVGVLVFAASLVVRQTFLTT